MLGALGTALLFTGCHYVDPQCLAPGFGISARRQHGVLLDLRLNLPHRRYTEAISLVIDGAGGVEYTEMSGDVTTCRHIGEEQREGLATLWTSGALEMSLPQCGPGYEFWRSGDEYACRVSRSQWEARRLSFLPYTGMVYYADEGPITLVWDLESQLPRELEEAFTDTLGLLCAENTRLARNLRRSVPELAARAGCLSAGA